MASPIDFGAHTAVAPYFRCLSCGCRVADGPRAPFWIDWCPHHEGTHGQTDSSPPSSERPSEMRRSSYDLKEPRLVV